MGHKSPVPVLAPEKTRRDCNAIGGFDKGPETVNGKIGNKTGRTVTLSCKGYREVTIGN